MLTFGINLTNIFWAAFALKFLRQNSKNLERKYKKVELLYEKAAQKMLVKLT